MLRQSNGERVGGNAWSQYVGTFVRASSARLTRIPALLLLGFVSLAGLVAALLFKRSSGPRVIRWYFERAGGGVVKIGQLLATRFDLLPPAYCEELGRLLDDLRPVPAFRIRFAIERSLGRPVEKLFSSFDDDPIGTASLAQVHGATLWTGEPVVVKVLKPGVGQLVTIDMSFLRVIARALGWFPLFSDLEVVTVAKELSRLAAAELDLQREASNLAIFNATMTKDQLPHYAPAPHRHLCAPDVLTMERINGVSVREILSALHIGDQEKLSVWAQKGITPNGISRLVFRSVLEQSMRHRMFNSDPHPSNLIVSDGGQLNWVDFGLVGWMDEKQWLLQLRLRQAFLRGEVHGAYRLFLESVGPLPDRDLRGFETQMKEAIRDYIVAARDAEAPIAERSTGAFLIRTLSALRRYRLPMSTEVMQLYRAILIADVVMLRLDPSVDWLKEMDAFLMEFLADQAEAAILSTAEDPSTFSAFMGIPSTLLAGFDLLDRRVVLGPQRAAPPSPSAADELVLSFVRLICFLGFLALIGTTLLSLGFVAAPSVGLLSQAASWVVRHPVASVVLAVAFNVVLQRWSRRFRR